MKNVKAQIKAQLRRECAQRGCRTSLAFHRASRFLCDTHKGVALATATTKNSKKKVVVRKTKAEVRRMNRDKKKRYYERHGIKFDKTIRKRSVKPTSQILEKGEALIYTGQILIYENYKEPLKPIEKNKGYGFYGTIASTDDKQYIQCHICGNLFSSVGLHIRIHKVSGEKYREMYGLSTGTSLISEANREKRQQNVVKPWDGKLPDHLVEYNRKVQKGLIKHPGNKGKSNNKRGSWTLEKRNKEGLCPDQVLEKIKDLAEELGTTPSYDEFIKRYNHRFVGSIRFQHGSFTEAVRKVGLKTRDELRRPDRESLIIELRDFYETNNRIPMTSDFNRGLLRDRGVFTRVFGSLNNARIEAGLNAVLPMPFGQVMEMSPDEYINYKARK